MLAGQDQVIDVLMLIGCVGPIALYFLALGLVNSHSRPCLVSSRSDAVLLSSALAPLLLWPIPSIVNANLSWPLIGLLAVGVLGMVALFYRSLPGHRSGFVIYNISENRFRRYLSDALDRIGWEGRWDGDTWRLGHGQLTLHVRSFALLRNVTIHVEGCEEAEVNILEGSLRRRLSGVAQLPSTTGACLVLVGVAMMILPIWMVSRHIDDLVEAVSYLFG